MSRRGSGQRESYWRKVIAQQRASGQSIAAFCRERDISPPSFYGWRRRLANRKTPQFVPVSLPATAAEFEVRLPNGIVVMVPGSFADGPLARLLQLVGEVEARNA